MQTQKITSLLLNKLQKDNKNILFMLIFKIEIKICNAN